MAQDLTLKNDVDNHELAEEPMQVSDGVLDAAIGVVSGIIGYAFGAGKRAQRLTALEEKAKELEAWQRREENRIARLHPTVRGFYDED